MDGNLELPASLSAEERAHLLNIASNLQLVADLGYGDVALAVEGPDGHLGVVADARPVTAVPAIASTRTGRNLGPRDEPEAYEALKAARPVSGERRRTTRGLSFTTSAYPVDRPPVAVILRDLTEQVTEAPGRMEVVFMEVAEDLLGVLADGPLIDVVTGRPFSTMRRAGDGFLRVDNRGVVEYASPNAVNILGGAGADGVLGAPASGLPGGAVAIAPVLGATGALAADVEVADRYLAYRTLSLPRGAFVLVQDVTEARRHEQELKVKEATIREVHHRVKNNLQTIASLLRIQARRTGSPEVEHALGEAGERISSMAVVHEMLAYSAEERVDFREVATTVVDMVRQSLTGSGDSVRVDVEGDTGLVPASMATSLALVTAELVHNAIEHGIDGRGGGQVAVSMRRLPDEVRLVVHDDGDGLPDDFDIENSANLGLAIVKTIVEDDLRGALSIGSVAGRGTTVTVRVPLSADGSV